MTLILPVQDARPKVRAKGFEPLTLCSGRIHPVGADPLGVALIALVNDVVQPPSLLVLRRPFRSFRVGKGWAEDWTASRPTPHAPLSGSAL